MVNEFKFPDVGEGIEEGEVKNWLIKEGENVKEDQALVEVETDKAVVELPSPYSGTVAKLHFKEGDIVKVGEVLITIAEPGEEVKVPEMKPAAVAVVGELEEAPPEEEVKVEKPAVETKVVKPTEKKILATPAVRKLAKDLGVDLALVEGTGPEGRITKEDVEAFSKKPKVEKPVAVKITRKAGLTYDMYGHIQRVPFKGIRRATAKKMTESWAKVPHVTHADEADVTELVKIRQKEKANALEKGIKLTYLPFIVKAVIAALKEHPYVNSTIDEETQEIVLKQYYNIGIAVDTEEGLMVPVVKIADKKSLLKIAEEIQNLAELAATRKIDLADLKGGTFTITNIGVIGGTYATPIVNYPEAAILGVGKIHDKPVVKDGEIVIRKILGLSLSFNHNIFDGAEAARFMNDVIKYLEDPYWMLIE
ncbi:MAG: dihydrolipoamide acetyltransferase family protein [Candidatus Hodarchaeota archaeon]